jgi:hypothetical protein
VDFSPLTLERFLEGLSADIYADADEARRALELNRPFNVIHQPTVMKIDLFPARGFKLGLQELDRAVFIAGTGLSKEAIPFVTPEDILIAKLHWFRAGGERSEVQWRDIEGIARTTGAGLDREYLTASAKTIGVADLLARALNYD